MKINKIYLIGALLLMLCLANIAYAQDNSIHRHSGKLVAVDTTGEWLNPNNPGVGWMKVIVSMEIGGITYFFTIYMTRAEYNSLKSQEGKNITISFHWDGKGHRIFDGWYPDYLNGIENPSTPIPNELKHRHGESCSPVPIDPNW